MLPALSLVIPEIIVKRAFAPVPSMFPGARPASVRKEYGALIVAARTVQTAVSSDAVKRKKRVKYLAIGAGAAGSILSLKRRKRQPQLRFLCSRVWGLPIRGALAVQPPESLR